MKCSNHESDACLTYCLKEVANATIAQIKEKQKDGY